MPNHYTVVSIPKKHAGEYRRIYIPDRDTMVQLRHLAGPLTTKAQKACPDVVHGFMRHRSAVSNAQAHIGHQFTLSFDLSDFFESVTPDKLKNKLSKDEFDVVFADGAARQGLPTSPAVANLAFASADRAILKWIQKRQKNIVYTRYADDLTFSYDDPTLTPAIKRAAREIVSRSGFALNPRKTRLQSAQHGRRIICGVAVDDQGVCPTRAAKRRLRAAQHHAATAPQNVRWQQRERGLREWCRLVPPDPVKDQKRQAQDDFEALRLTWRLRKVEWSRLRQKILMEDVILPGGTVITGDAAQIMGMSTYTTGWTSCMRQPSGQFRRGVMFWVAAPASFLAYLPSGHTATFAGVERPRMKARVLVHVLQDGRKIYDRLYGNPQDMPPLKADLEAAGYMPASSVPSGSRVWGVVTPSRLPRPYFDRLRAVRVTLKSGQPATRLEVE